MGGGGGGLASGESQVWPRTVPRFADQSVIPTVSKEGRHVRCHCLFLAGAVGPSEGPRPAWFHVGVTVSARCARRLSRSLILQRFTGLRREYPPPFRPGGCRPPDPLLSFESSIARLKSPGKFWLTAHLDTWLLLDEAIESRQSFGLLGVAWLVFGFLLFSLVCLWFPLTCLAPPSHTFPPPGRNPGTL